MQEGQFFLNTITSLVTDRSHRLFLDRLLFSSRKKKKTSTFFSRKTKTSIFSHAKQKRRLLQSTFFPKRRRFFFREKKFDGRQKFDCCEKKKMSTFLGKTSNFFSKKVDVCFFVPPADCAINFACRHVTFTPF